MENIEELIIKNFKLLTKGKQVKLLEELNLLANKNNKDKQKPEFFINQIKQEIKDAKDGDYEPRDINNSTLNLIIEKAKNNNEIPETIAELERLAYRGIVEWANAYGYLSDQDEDFAVDHLENFIEIVKKDLAEQKDKLFLEEENFLRKKSNDNFYSDYLIEAFESGTGLDV